VRSRSNLRRATVVVVAVFVALLASAPAGSAAGKPKPAGTEFRLTGDNAKKGEAAGEAAAAAWSCQGSATPPTTSGGFLLWEGHITCTQTFTIRSWINVYRIDGTGDNQHNVWVGFTPARTRTGTWLDIYDDDPCQGFVATRYFTQHYGEINGQPMIPYPANSPVRTLNCYQTAE
jgi:hypothetical protein